MSRWKQTNLVSEPAFIEHPLYADLNALRMEAMTLFEHSLAEGAPDKLLAFLEKHIVQEPPPISLFYEISEDLHQRLQSMRQFQFDLRERALTLLGAELGCEGDTALAAHIFRDTLENLHLLDGAALHTVFSELDGQRMIQPLLTTLDNLRNAAIQIHHDLLITQELYDFVTDWTFALHVMLSQHTWTDEAAHRKNRPH